jgi:predicted Zn-dependent protease
LAFCKPLFRLSRRSASRAIGFLIAPLCVLLSAVQPVAAAGISVLRDTEIERVLRSYEDPILAAAGIDPHTVKLFLIDDPEINAFATQSPMNGHEEDIFVNAGAFLQLKTPNQLIGVLAHETGHIAGGDVIHSEKAMANASIPMLIGMAVGIAAMAMGAGDAGMGAVMMGEQAGIAQFLQFSRAQEATADQRGQKFLLMTHQSGNGMVEVFEQMANDFARSAYYNKEFLSDHPADRDRVALLQREADASPYRDTPDKPEVVHEFHLIQAKLAGYLSKPATVLQRYPTSDTSVEARYARAMAYFRQPDMKNALLEANALVKLEPNNPYFWELLGQINVDMSQPDKGVGPYQKAVDLMPDAPLLRISLAAAQLATERKSLAQPALTNLKIALDQENDNTFGWFETAQAYSDLGNEPMANLSTAELDYTVGNYSGAAHFATLAQHKLAQGSTDWQRASDILAIAGPNAEKRR